MNLNLAYLIQAHKNYEQIIKLVDILVDENTDIFMHIDKKNSQLFKELELRYADNNLVHIFNDIDVNWSGFSQVETTLRLMNEVKKSRKKFDYISLISGQDFPIKSKRDIKNYLLINKGKEFIEYEDIGRHFWRLKCYNFFRENKYNRKLALRILDNIIRRPQIFFIKRNNLNGKNLYFGSQWFTITFECMLYILEYLEENPGYIKEFKWTACPDEHFFQILILNSKFKDNVINNNLRYIIFLQGKNSPETITINDMKKLIESDKLFARKFDISIDQTIINKLIQMHKNNKLNSDDETYRKR